ncbi:MAG: fibronectin type III domain-containing protein [Myxococcota bacterium]
MKKSGPWFLLVMMFGAQGCASDPATSLSDVADMMATDGGSDAGIADIAYADVSTQDVVTPDTPDTPPPADAIVDPEPALDVAEPDAPGPPDTASPPDELAPTWGAEPWLQALGVGEAHLTLSWTEAFDESGVEAYLVYQDELLVSRMAAAHQALEVSQLSAGATYVFRVEAEDPLGNVSDDGPTLTVTTADETAPQWSEPSELSATDITASNLTLAWGEALDNVALSGYRVYQDNIAIGSVAAGETSLAVTGLEAWTSYLFRVEAEDAEGNLSSSGPSVMVQTLDELAPMWSEGAEVVVSGLTPTGLYLGWDAATDDVAVTAYQVLQDKVEIALVDGATTWLQVQGLSPWTDYAFEVHAWDAGGNSTGAALSAEVMTPDEEAPTWADHAALLASSAEADGVTLGWSAAQDDVAVTGYRLYQDNVEIDAYAADTLSVALSGLDPSTGYIFRIEAEDAAGNLSFGGPTLALDLSDKTPPQWPEGATLEATDAGPTWVTLSWTEATDNHGVAGYQISSDDALIASVSAEETSVTIEDLVHLSAYTFSVQASDGAGNVSTDDPSVEVLTPDHPIPSWPEGATLVASEVGYDAATLSWTDADEGVVSYEVYQDDTLVATTEAPTTTWSASGLLPATAYAFRVEAVGPTGKVSSDGPVTDVLTEALEPPSWPEDAVLTASDITEDGLTLSWPAQPVVSYQVTRDGEPIGAVDAPLTSLAVSGLTLGVAYTFTVESVGPTGLVSIDGPSLTVSTSDITAPSWGAGATLTAEAVGSTTVTLVWTPATDNVAVTGYTLTVDGAPLGTTGGDVTTFAATGLSPATSVVFQVQAMDAAGHVTADGPTLAVTTEAAVQGVSDQAVLDALKPTCQACHGPWFASMSDFTSHVIDNAEVVTPGDPDGSLLILYLEEEGPGSGQMPPGFFDPDGDSFMDMSDKGETALTVQEIRDWISAM